MRNRLERGRLHKAQRGELFHRVPTGYIKLSPDRVEMDPDDQVREVVRHIFDKYDELGTAWGSSTTWSATTSASDSGHSTGPIVASWSGGARSC